MLSCSSGKKDQTDEKLSAYLMVYFKDDSHSLYMALSNDGYTFTALNDSKPIMAGDMLALQRGIRDPHIYRGPDNSFYLAMTDLHIFGKEQGLRETQWERDDSFGWGNNRALVLMKSDDLIHWTKSNVRVDTAFPGLEEIGCAWAPETTYDDEKGKMMVYFTMRTQNGHNRLYYSYTNDDFTKLETKPELLFEYPQDISYIDADITKVGDKYHMFYTPHDKGGPGIKQAVSDRLNEGYVYQDEWVDFEDRACEAPNVWKRLDSDTYVLMYDCYGIRPHNFGFCETTDFVTFKDLGHLNEGVMKATNFSSPKHGAVIHLTALEANELAQHWGSEMKF